MKRLSYIVCTLCGLLLCGCSDREHYARLLAEAEQMNADYVPFTSDSTMLQVVDYYDSHGTPNERLRAHYMLGCVYRDLGEAPHALDCFHDAVMCADTTATDCDFCTLSRVHSQTAALLGEQMLPRQQLEELHLQYADAMRAKDTLCALNAMGQMANAYDMLGIPDSTIDVSNKLADIYYNYGLYKKMALAKGGMILSLIDLKRFEDAKECIDSYESKTEFFDDSGDIEAGREFFYGIKGRYFLGISHYDSAEYYFRKELQSAGDLNNREYAYRGLFLLYQKTGQRDSMSKYAQLAYETTDAHFREKQTDELRHMQSLYNYSRNQSIARQKTAEANHNRIMIIVLLFVLAFVLITSIFAFLYFRRRKQSQIREQQLKYKHNIEKMEQALDDLYKVKQIKDEQATILIQEKTDYIEQLQQRLEEYETLNERESNTLERIIIKSDVYQRFLYLSQHPREGVTRSDWEALQMMFEDHLPNFHSTIYHYCPNLSNSDYRLCMLVRLFFTPSNIAVLTGMTLANISVKRYRLLDKVFNQKEGSAKDFDKTIRNIK